MQSLPVFSVSTTMASMFLPSTLVIATEYLGKLKTAQINREKENLVPTWGWCLATPTSPPTSLLAVNRLTKIQHPPVHPGIQSLEILPQLGSFLRTAALLGVHLNKHKSQGLPAHCQLATHTHTHTHTHTNQQSMSWSCKVESV